jgi:hypothetical protein
LQKNGGAVLANWFMICSSKKIAEYPRLNFQDFSISQLPMRVRAMSDLSSVRFFRLSSEGIGCDEAGLRVGDVSLLTRDDKGAWAVRASRDLDRDLSRVYGFPVEVAAKMAGFANVANALQSRDIAKAQIAALLLRLPDPLAVSSAPLGKSLGRHLAEELAACGLLKADADWDEKHPRTGSPPNRAWFASKPKDAQADEPPKAIAKPDDGASSRSEGPGGNFTVDFPKLAAGANSVLAENLSTTALEGLATLASRVSVPTILFGAIFIPSANPLVFEGSVPGRPDVIYRWGRDENEVTFKVLADGHLRTLTVGRLGPDAAFRDPDGNIVARLVLAAGRRPTLVTALDVLDRGDGKPKDNPNEEELEPRLCPIPTPERKTTYSINSILYQEYVSKLPYGWAIKVGGVDFDGCDPLTGDLLEAKADIDLLFNKLGELLGFVRPEKNPRNQMVRQARAALAAGRQVVWHAQTEWGYRGLSKLAEKLRDEDKYKNLVVVYDPN